MHTPTFTRTQRKLYCTYTYLHSIHSYGHSSQDSCLHRQYTNSRMRTYLSIHIYRTRKHMFKLGHDTCALPLMYHIANFYMQACTFQPPVSDSECISNIPNMFHLFLANLSGPPRKACIRVYALTIACLVHAWRCVHVQRVLRCSYYYNYYYYNYSGLRISKLCTCWPQVTVCCAWLCLVFWLRTNKLRSGWPVYALKQLYVCVCVFVYVCAQLVTVAVTVTATVAVNFTATVKVTLTVTVTVTGRFTVYLFWRHMKAKDIPNSSPSAPYSL